MILDSWKELRNATCSIRWLVGSLCLFALGVAGCENDPLSPPAAQEEAPPASQEEIAPLGSMSTMMTSARGFAPASLETEIVNERGKVIWSADGVGKNQFSSGTITIEKPSGGATVRKAVLAAATEPGAGTIPNGTMTIDGAAVAWDQTVPGAIGTVNHWADVTGMLTAKLSAAGAGPIDFTISEGDMSDGIDGSALIVVWEDAAIVGNFSVIVLFGAQDPDGDTFRVFMDDPFTSSGFAEMSLGISHGCNRSSRCNPDAETQFILVDIDGQRLTSSAGGMNDGFDVDGMLFTIGGFGDSNTNPPPFASPSLGNDPDDEYYNITSFITPGSTFFDVFSQNPSDDDNLFLALFYVSPSGSSEPPPPPPPPSPECSDGVDNDGDGAVDFPADPGCSAPGDDDESDDPECSDGVDNDDDGAVDFPADPDCSAPGDDDESGDPAPQCSDGVDNDDDGSVDFPSDPGCEDADDDDETDPAPQCSDGIDNDGDGRVDWPFDPHCENNDDDDESFRPDEPGACKSALLTLEVPLIAAIESLKRDAQQRAEARGLDFVSVVYDQWLQVVRFSFSFLDQTLRDSDALAVVRNSAWRFMQERLSNPLHLGPNHPVVQQMEEAAIICQIT